MNETSTMVVIIILAVALVGICIIFAIMLYHQLLLLNEYDKRLHLLTKDSIERGQNIMAEYEELLQEYNSAVQTKTADTPINENQSENEEEAFNPHLFEQEGDI